jgi:hypothetical protein
MAKIRLRRWEVEEYELPPVCARCGERAVVQPDKTFSWHPPWVLVFLFIGGLLIYVIVALILTKRMTVPLPFCRRHRNYWRNRAMFVYGGLFGLLLLTAGGVIASLALDPAGQGAVLGTVCVGAFLIFLVWLIAAAIMQTNGIRTNEITDRFIVLVGLSREFVDAVYDDRDAAEEQAKQRWRDSSRDSENASRVRRRKPEDDDSYFDPPEKRRGIKAKEDRDDYDQRKEGRRRHRQDEDDY